MIDIATETLVSLPDAAQHLPGRPHASTIFRWAARGVRGIKLETCLLGGRRFTSQQDLQRFSQATTIAAQRNDAPSGSVEGVSRESTPAPRPLQQGGL